MGILQIYHVASSLEEAVMNDPRRTISHIKVESLRMWRHTIRILYHQKT